MDNVDFASLGGSVVSTLVMVVGFMTPYILAVPVGAVLFTASISYFFQRRIQTDIRKYEKRRLAVTEVLGPLHGELLEIINTFESNERQYFMSHPILSMIPESEWQKIRHSHRFYLIPEQLRNELVKFFSALDPRLYDTTLYDTTTISNIAIRVCASLLGGFKLRNYPRFKIENKYGIVIEIRSFWGLIFWKVPPTAQTPGKLKEVTLETEVADPDYGSQVQTKTFTGKEAHDFTEKFLKAAWEESDRDPDIRKSREMHQHLHGQARYLYEKVQKQIEEWAE